VLDADRSIPPETSQQQLNPANDATERLQDDLKQSVARETQLQQQLDKITAEFDDYKQCTAPLLQEQEMLERDSKI